MISIKDLRFRYHHQKNEALAGLSLEVPEGGIVLVSGPTGCGKSTLGLILAGAIPHAVKGRLSGSITVGELNPAVYPLRQTARRVGLLLQNVECQIVADRVEDEVAFGLENLAIDPQKMPPIIAHALRTVQAEHLKGRLLTSLSAGERQRVMLAAMLGLGQRVLILDEPLAYLDRHAAAGLIDLVSALGRQGKTVIILEHRRHPVMPVVEKEICLCQGKLAEQPVPEAILPTMASARRNGEPMLAGEGIAFGWNQTESVFQNLSFEIRSGESHVLLGDNGAGKTTLLKLAVGLLPLGSGRLWAAGLKVSGAATRKLAKSAALVLQNPDHQLRLPSVFQEVSWGAASPQATAREIQALGLTGLEDRHPHSLSSGQKRRVTIAAALARQPKLLLLDEPTVGQDDANLEIMLRRLGEFVQDGGAVLTATHDVRAARFLGQQVLLLKKGRTILGGSEMVEIFFGWEAATASTQARVMAY